jgi:hypothetical protein
MKRGRMLEPLAIEAYVKSEAGAAKIKSPGFVTNSRYPGCGYSPDDIDRNFLLEVKCLNGERHEELVRGHIPPDIMAQIQFGLMITGHKWGKIDCLQPRQSE